MLRDTLDLKGTKFGCGIGQCAACTVHVGGQPQRSWQEVDVPQCGYCQAGQIMAAAALLARTPSPSDADIDEQMNAHICRCATYLRIREAIHRAATIAAQD